MNDRYVVIVKKNDDPILEFESDNFQVRHQRKIEPVYSVACTFPVSLDVVEGSEEVIITIKK
jgi:hypothetical protein